MLLLILGFLFVAAAIAILAMALRPADTAGVHRSLAVLEAMSAAPREIADELDRDFADRVLEPLRARALRLGRRLSGRDAADRIRRRLDLAGNPHGWTVDKVLSGKVLLAGFGLLAGGAIGYVLGFAPTVGVLAAVAGLALGFFTPDLFLRQRAYDRSERIQRELADAIDLLTISVEAGLGFDAAVQQVTTKTDGPLAEELARMLREMQLGTSRSDALRGLGDRTNVDDVQSFVTAMVQADAFGIPIAQVLRVQSAEIRTKRRQWAERKAQQVPVKITVPLIFCILPCLFAMIMGPAVLEIMDRL